MGDVGEGSCLIGCIFMCSQAISPKIGSGVNSLVVQDFCVLSDGGCGAMIAFKTEMCDRDELVGGLHGAWVGPFSHFAE